MQIPNLSELSVREKSVTLFFLCASLAAGVYAFLSLGRAEDPAFVVRIMVVSVVWPGATPDEIQDQVVDRLEKRIQEVDYLYRIETSVRPGRADLQVEFHDYTPAEKVKDVFYDVRKRMLDEQPQLPQGVIGPIVNDDFSDVYFSLIAVSAPGLQMRQLTRETEVIRGRLQQMAGVHKALIIGERTERIHIDFDMPKLTNLGISPVQVFDAIEAYNRLTPAGFIETNGPRVYLRVDADLSNLDNLNAVPLRIGDTLLKLSDIATIQRGYEDPPTYMIRSRGNDVVLLGVVMKKGENGLEFGERLEQFIEHENEILPLGMELTVLTNQREAIEAAVHLFQKKFLVAVAVVMVVSALAIGLRAGLIVGIAVPVTLGLTFLMMSFAGINLDRITLGALIISLGLLVDDAIIAIEMMIVKMEEGWDRERAAAHAWTVTAAPMLFGTMVTVAGFVPIGFAKSGVGEYAGNIFWVLAYSLTISWFVAVTFTPYLGVKLLPNFSANHRDHHVPYQSRSYRVLRSLIRICVRFRKSVVLATVGLLLISAYGMANHVKQQFFPSSDRPEVLISIYLPKGSAIHTTDKTVKKMEAILTDKPEVKSLASFVGAGAPRFFISANPEQPDPAFAKLVAIAKDETARDAIIRELEQRIADGEFPEARVRVARLLFGPAVPWPLAFRVIGPESEQLRIIGDKLRARMADHPNVVDAHLEWNERSPELHLTADADKLRLVGLTPRDLALQLQFVLDGAPVTEVRQDIRTVQVRARARRDIKPGDYSLELKTQDGRKVPLSQIGNLEIHFEDPFLQRYNRQPSLSVVGDTIGAQAPDVTREIWNSVEDLRNELPYGYEIRIAGTVEQSEKANASIQKLQPLMLALMLVFIMVQVRTFSGMFIVLATAPLGLVGAVASLLLFDRPFGFVALLGLIGLAGILMRNTMILTQQVQDNLAAEMSTWDAVIEAAVQRARPVVLTALAAVLAFVPLTTDAFWGPMAYVLIGGIAAGTAITLFVVPALYALWYRIKEQHNPETT